MTMTRVLLMRAAACACAFATAFAWADEPPRVPAGEKPPIATADDAAGAFAKFRTPASDLPFLDSANAWPARFGFEADDWRRGVIAVVENAKRKPKGQHVRGAGEPDVAEQTAAKEQFASLVPSAGGRELVTRVRRGGFPVRSAAVAEGESLARADVNIAAITMRFVSATEREPGGPLELSTTWFTVFEPADAPASRGVAVVMPGMLGTPEGTLVALQKRLVDRGWTVLRMVAQPSRFSETFVATVDPSKPDAEAAMIATRSDNGVAEIAFAVQAATRRLEELRPTLASKPRVMLGSSAGALTLPTVAAREPERYQAAVMIGGGCHFWLMGLTSNYNDWLGLTDISWTTPPTDTQLRTLEEAYLRKAALDSYHTAKALHGKPVLIFQGTQDLAVPSPLGDVLFERLKSDGHEPERELLTGGHEALFMALPVQFDRIVNWIDEKVPAGEMETKKTP
ncbi:MAG TPA: prolyl oligopeptidase family serine peptidase [Phycisphaerales bacterium]|nr:prolyl oligopeptidase family serine peptidase [Phycisphaerales bacterium]